MPILNKNISVIQLNNNEGILTENSEIPNNLIQKWSNISYNGGLLPVDSCSIIEMMSNWAMYILKGSSPAIELLEI